MILPPAPQFDPPTLEDDALSVFLDRLEGSIRDDLRIASPTLTLHEFVEQAWSINEPIARFVDNWHIGAITEHLTAITQGQLGDIIINIPPGCMKSLLCSVMWPAWEWTFHPSFRYLCASYEEQLSTRDNRKMRNIVESSWYQERWPLKFKRDQNTKTKFENEKTGWRMGSSVGGRATGEHPHRKIIDDPHNVKKSLSDVSRKEAITWFDLTMGSRGLGLGAVTVIIMQRLHEEDLSGHVLATQHEQYTHICLPMFYEPPAFVDMGAGPQLTARMPETPLGFQDPRTEKGELLWPAFLDAEKVAKEVAQLSAQHGEFGPAGQLQQRPIPEGGGLFKREWFMTIDALPADIIRWTRGWDCAATEGDGDFTVGVLLALTSTGITIICDVVRGQWGPDSFENPETGVFISTARKDGKGVRIREELEPGSAGKKVIAAHAKLLKGYDYEGVPATGDKVTRARPFRSQAAVGNVRMLRNELWNAAYLKIMCGFPNASHDDDVDATSTAYNDLALEPPKPRAGVW